MLLELHVADLGVVEDATLELAPGLNVLTGETGAGKTMITVGLALALGGRGSASSVRTGARGASIEARFEVSPAVAGEIEVLADEDGQPGGGTPVEAVLARAMSAEGRGSSRVNGRLAPLSALSAIGERLVEIHGQNQASRLLAPAAQIELLDRFAGPGHLDVAGRYRGTHRDLRRAEQALRDLEGDARERERQRDLLQYQIREIEAAGVSPGEMARLGDDESRLAHAERILELAAAAQAAVGEEDGAADALRRAAASMQAVEPLDPSVSALSARVRSVAEDAADVALELRAYGEGVAVDPDRLAATQERLRALASLERKYGDGEAGILGYLEEARAGLAGLDGDYARREALAARVAALRTDVDALAAELTEGRTNAAPDLGAQLTAEVRALGMTGADVRVELRHEDGPGPAGAERVELAFSGGPGQPHLPIGKAASGGELSRVMLACRAVLADLDDVPTLVFDEVDAGIGGRTAAAVADRLARVGQARQVLVVTHLAQIAARADRHFLVTKEEGRATVRLLEGEARVEELARMLSGRTGSASLAHARELIDAPVG